MSAKNGKRNMRQTLIMAVLCVVLITGATFAWFTLSDTARISNLTLTVGEATSLLIAEENAGKTGPDVYKSDLPLKTVGDNVRLLPATVKEELSAYTVYKPVYTDDGSDGDLDVTAIDAVDTSSEGTNETFYTFDGANAEADEKDIYFLEKTFYLRTDKDDAEHDVVLKIGEGLDGKGYLTGEDTTGIKGTYIVAKNGTDVPVASASLRISFECETTSTKGIFEPNTDLAGSGSFADDERGDTSVADVTVKQNKDGTFVVTNADGSTDSEALFKITGQTDNKIVMKVWIEGTDAQCVDEISFDSLIGSLKFALKP